MLLKLAWQSLWDRKSSVLLTLLSLSLSVMVVLGVLTLISCVVLVASLLGLATMLLASMQQLQRELALYRAIGAHPGFLLLLIEFEALLITVTGLLMGFAGAAMAQLLIAPWLQRGYGGLPWSGMIAAYIGIVLGAAALLALIPALSAYRRSLGGALTQAR
jgi:putative ABC transport system permease protein